MGRQRIYKDYIIDVLTSQGPGDRTQITERVDQKYHCKIHKVNMYENLKFLKGQGKVTDSRIPRSKGSRKVKVWAITPKCYEEMFRKELVGLLDGLEPFQFLAAQYTQPLIVSLGSKAENLAEFDYLEQATRERFGFELRQLIHEEFGKEDRGRLEFLLANLIWAGHKKLTADFPYALKKLKPPNPWMNMEGYRAMRKLVSMKNLGQLLRSRLKTELIVLISPVLAKHFRDFYDMMPRSTLSLLERTVRTLSFEQAETISGSEEQTIALLSQPENRRLLSIFFERLSKKRFILMSFVGYKKLEEISDNYVVIGFDSWMSDLQEGKLDERDWIFDEGIPRVRKFMKCLERFRKEQKKYGEKLVQSKEILKEKGGNEEGPASEIFEQRFYESFRNAREEWKLDRSERWNLPDLFANHPQGHNQTFYTDIRDAIEKRRAAKRIASTRTKGSKEDFLDLF